MKINRYNWEPNFFIKSSFSSVDAYDFLNQQQRAANFSLETRLLMSVDTNRSSDFSKTFLLLKNIEGNKIFLLPAQQVDNKKDKEKENKFRFLLITKNNLLVLLYLFIYVYLEIFEKKNIKYSSYIADKMYSTDLHNLNSILKLTKDPRLSEIDPTIKLNFNYSDRSIKNIFLQHITNNKQK